MSGSAASSAAPVVVLSTTLRAPGRPIQRESEKEKDDEEKKERKRKKENVMYPPKESFPENRGPRCRKRPRGERGLAEKRTPSVEKRLQNVEKASWP